MTTPSDKSKRCGAKNRRGEPCGVRPMAGKERCAVHGGKTPKGRHHGPMTHGIYGASLTAEERGIWPAMIDRLGSVDEEIHVIRFQLRRALLAQHKADEEKGRAALEVAEIRESDSGGDSGPRVDVVSRRTDFHGIIDRLSGRLASLEKTRTELLAAARDSGGNVADTARDLTEALKAMVNLETKDADC